MRNLLGLNLEELTNIAKEYNLPTFIAKQMSDWIYKKRVNSVDLMQNISKNTRELLAQNFKVGFYEFSDVQISTDGTKKYLFNLGNNKFIEAAYIPNKDRHTLCISTQAGCKMGCLFCMTAKQGFQAHLTAGEIVNQLYSIPEFDKITNIVYMGMGEPFDNTEQVIKSINILTSNYGLEMSPKRITVSTIGIIPGMEQFLKQTNAHLAISLHNPFAEERIKIMPLEKTYPIKKIVETLRKYDFSKQRRVSFEYIMFKDFNDSQAHVNELSKLLNKINCRLNLIRFHKIPNIELQGADEETILSFQQELMKKGITTTIRTSRGLDILAACGLLSTQKLVI